MKKKVIGRVSTKDLETINTRLLKSQDGQIYNTAVPYKYLKDVKVSDGEKNVLTDDNGKYEIETSKTELEFSKNGFESKIINISILPVTMDNKILAFTYLEPSTEQNKNVGGDEKILGLEKSRFYTILGVVALLGVGLTMIIPKLKKK
jgi:hypothetical protein